jgi:leucyl aminopeptidase
VDIQAASAPVAPAQDALVVVAATTTDDGPVVSGDVDGIDIDLTDALQAVDFTGERGETARLPLPTGGSVLVVGCGEDLRGDAVREFGACAARAAVKRAHVDVVLPATDDDRATSQTVAEGLVLGAYRFVDHRSEPEEVALEGATVHGEGVDADAVTLGRTLGEAAALARDLVNTPPNHKRPPDLAGRAVELVQGTGITANVLDGDALREGGYGGLLAVGQGSSVDPQLVELTWEPDGATGDHVALVGKGITFDTGGISLKGSSNMETMKMDMGGAATVLAAVLAVARLQLPVRITALLCLAENMPSGTAQRVSDVSRRRGGTTVEVMNTDAEGRLVLADGIVHACGGRRRRHRRRRDPDRRRRGRPRGPLQRADERRRRPRRRPAGGGGGGRRTAVAPAHGDRPVPGAARLGRRGHQERRWAHGRHHHGRPVPAPLRARPRPVGAPGHRGLGLDRQGRGDPQQGCDRHAGARARRLAALPGVARRAVSRGSAPRSVPTTRCRVRRPGGPRRASRPWR